ncbi:BCCT family transporter [Streptomonospora nanhaiensis]|uniref:BCCT family transporter n=1 Tax=Streptomonospora nanhaiensis TaxID=1323731 RepID=UPI001C3942D5|nr:BCCT family transporter [Streptomonospora nanhaiensis]MBV2366367.1 BCCT family transporter [Streptomonospora nanhaiensis]
MTETQETPASTTAPPDRPVKPRLDPVVFGVSITLAGVFCVLGAVWPDQVSEYGTAALNWIVANLGWVFVLATTGFVVFALVLAFSRYGRIPLSANGEPPEFSTVSWVAMMFSAGMGIGLIFFGIYEPVWHFANTPPQTGVADGSEQAVTTSMAYTLFHWGLHPWAIYAVVALALAYSMFRKGRGNLISSPFQSLTGKEVENTWWGKGINIWSIIATKFGGATSLGLGALQIGGGIYLFTGIGGNFTSRDPEALNVAFAIIVVLVIFAILSAVSGVGRGIKWLSNTNMVLAVLLVAFVVVVGPTVFLFNLIPEAIGAYIVDLLPMSFRAPLFGDAEWFSGWTIFYWAWWISWTPFVSTFIARISRGRTIREFVLGVLLVPTLVSALWFIFLGGAGVHLQMNGVDIAAAPDEAVAFFTALQEYPGFTVTGILVMVLVAIFWVSGADASALVLATLSSRGAIEPNKWLVALWAALSAVVAGVLLYMGGLDALQTFTILVASPFIVVMIGLCWALYVDLRRDPLRGRRLGPVRGNAPSPGSYGMIMSAIAPATARTAPTGGAGGGEGAEGETADGGGAKAGAAADTAAGPGTSTGASGPAASGGEDEGGGSR